MLRAPRRFDLSHACFLSRALVYSCTVNVQGNQPRILPARAASWSMQFLDPEVEPGCIGKLRRLSTGLPGPNFDLGPHFSALILSLSTFSFSMHFFAFSDTEI